VLGFPASSVVWERLGTFTVNLVTISLTAGSVYAIVGMRKEEAGKFRSKASGGYLG
jgi:hypothetical protein